MVPFFLTKFTKSSLITNKSWKWLEWWDGLRAVFIGPINTIRHVGRISEFTKEKQTIKITE